MFFSQLRLHFQPVTAELLLVNESVVVRKKLELLLQLRYTLELVELTLLSLNLWEMSQLAFGLTALYFLAYGRGHRRLTFREDFERDSELVQ